MAKQDTFVVLIDLDNITTDDDQSVIVGPFVNTAAADEFCDEAERLTTDSRQVSLLIDQPTDQAEVLAALKAERKARRKADKKAAKKAAKKEKKGKGKKGNGDEPQPEPEQEPSPIEGGEPTAEAEVELTPAEQEKREQLSEKARKQPWAGKLAEEKDSLIEQWAKALGDVEVLKPLALSPQQRRVIAALKWQREVSHSNAHLPATIIQPPPIVGVDSNQRIVVQQIDNGSGEPRQWAVYKNGNPADVKEPITRLKASASEAL
jgi:hypothetical protein